MLHRSQGFPLRFERAVHLRESRASAGTKGSVVTMRSPSNRTSGPSPALTICWSFALLGARQCEGDEPWAAADRERDVLAAVDHVGHRRPDGPAW